MGEMAASLAHQLRTPLATALLYSANLGQADLADAARVRFADKTTAQLQRLERLIQEVLLFARGESIGRDTIAAGQLLADAAQTVQPLFLEKKVAFRVICGAGEVIVTGSRKALAGALVNLLENALQACTAGGQGDPLAPKPPVGSCASACAIPVPGSLPRSRLRVFDPFFTTRGRAPGSVWRSPSASCAHTGGASASVRYRERARNS
jgi:two-component system sensor histidine kinase FlrB